MESPVVLDKPPEYHGIDDRGFPFEEEEGGGAWSELSARHPDIAARLRQHPAAWGRKRRPSSHDADDFDDSFGDFDRLIPSEFREHFPSHFGRRFGREEPPRTPEQARTSQSPPKQQTTATQTEVDPPPEPSHLPQYGLRNTVDLGQKSAVDPSLVDADERTQRSLSAPPDSRSMSAPPREPSPHAELPSEPRKVRNIPIYVEGRDAPVINDTFDHAPHFAEPKPHQPPDATYFTEEAPLHFNNPPNFTRSFGTPFSKQYRQGQPFAQKVYPQKAQAFGHGAPPPRSQSPKPHEEFVKLPVHHETSSAKPQQQKPEAPRPQQKPEAPRPQQRQQQPPPPPQQPPSPPPPPAPKPCPNDPITRILEIQTNVLNLMAEVEKFSGTKKDKHYLYLDEMLTLNLLKLDNIETEGKENIRNARKEAIRCIQKCIAVLEAKAESNSANAPQEAQDVDMAAEGAPQPTGERATENGEVEMKETPKEEVRQEEHKPEAAPADSASADATTEESAPGNAEVKSSHVVKNKCKDMANKEEKNETVDDKGDKMDVDSAASQ